jgi:antibiotic biosynthesis monooxygenase (ABM) superfamily enzyme
MNTEASEEIITLLIRHRVHDGHAQHYEAWLRRTVCVAHGYPGHLGIDVIRSREGNIHLFTCILRFARADQLQDWLSSIDRQQLIDEVKPLLLAGDELETRNAREFWFIPNEGGSPPRWKQACVSFLVILPLSLLIPWLWHPIFERVPWLSGYLMRNVLITLSIVLSVVYLFMPVATRWLANWLNASHSRS